MTRLERMIEEYRQEQAEVDAYNELLSKCKALGDKYYRVTGRDLYVEIEYKGTYIEYRVTRSFGPIDNRQEARRLHVTELERIINYLTEEV